MIEVDIQQHPVGQGSLLFGAIKNEKNVVSWIFDCGSNQTDALNREINNIPRERIDYLFVSHLDSDHVNGLDKLLARVKVVEVVLPYLNELDKIVALAHDCRTGVITTEFQSFISDIPGWFSARGIDRISFITPKSDDDTNDRIDSPQRSPSDRGNNNSQRWQCNKLELIESAHNVEISKYDSSAKISFSWHTDFDWLFTPFAHRPSESRLQAFKEALRIRLTEEITTSSLVEILKDADRTRILKECYEEIWSDHNLVSMALYFGPSSIVLYGSSDHFGWYLSWRSRRFYRFLIDAPIGWLTCGDMHLERAKRRSAFLNHYKHIIDNVGIIVLPHHGSEHNFDSQLVSSIPDAELFIAASGKNSYGHPSPSVKSFIRSVGKKFLKVSAKPKSLIKLYFQIN